MRMSKVPEYPRPHNRDINFDMGAESAVVNNNTIVPIMNYDEGLGVINSYKSNPENASFAEYSGPNCYPTSRIDKIFCQLTASLTKLALETDKIHALKFGTNLIHSAFNETGLANDEKSGLDLNEILELQVETTDRQMFPLYNTVDLKDGKTNLLLDMGADQAGLDTDLEIEGVAFAESKFYDCLHYYTNGKKLKSVQTGLQWHTLTKQNPVKVIRWNQQSNTKYMNPYTFLGVYVSLPQNASMYQIGKAAETTDVGHINFTLQYRFNEWNHEFNHALQ